jgi:hypothetical protein
MTMMKLNHANTFAAKDQIKALGPITSEVAP